MSSKKKRTISDLSPDLQTENKPAKKGMMDCVEIKEMFGEFQQMLANIEKNIEGKIEKLPTKDDFVVFRNEMIALKEENVILRERIEKLERERAEDRTRLEMMDKYNRSKNLIIEGLKPDDSPRKAVQDLLKDVLGIQDEMGIERVKPIKKNEKSLAVLVQFTGVSHVGLVLANTNKLRNTKISVERDLTEAERERKKNLLKIKKIIKNKVTSEDDKRRRIRVTADILRIESSFFYWKNNKLMCGKEEAAEELNKIFNFNFNNINFLNEICILDKQRRVLESNSN